MSGSGKTTLARAVYKKLKPEMANLVYLDGDEFREIFQNDVDHTVEGRRKNAERISHFCRVLDSQGIHVIAAVLSIFPEWQAWNRETYSHYFEVFLDISQKTLDQRDTKGIYAAARDGKISDVVGYDIPFPRPTQPELVITDTDQQHGLKYCTDKVLKNLPAF